MLKLWLINGWSDNIGQWEVEIFLDKDEAIKAFNYYVEEYEATVGNADAFTATCANGSGVFWMEEREVYKGGK